MTNERHPAEETWSFRAPPAPRATPERVDRPTMSVVVAAYNCAGTVRDAVESALGQTVAPLEVVVCDDGSTDGTAEVLAELGERITVVRQDNRGEAAAKNAAVAASRGEYVVVLDADDVFDPRRLEALGTFAMARPDLDILTTDAWLEIDGVAVRRAYGSEWSFETTDQRSAILVRNFILGLAAVRRSRWIETGGFREDITHTTDWEFWQRLILTGSAAGLVDAPLARYRLHADSLSANRPKLVRGRIRVLEAALARPDLTRPERRAVTAALRVQRRSLLMSEARAALGAKAPQARGLSMRVALAPGVGIRTRLKAIAAAISPGAAGGRLGPNPRDALDWVARLRDQPRG